MPLCSLLPPGNAVALVTHVLIDTTHVRVATVAFNDEAVNKVAQFPSDLEVEIQSEGVEVK